MTPKSILEASVSRSSFYAGVAEVAKWKSIELLRSKVEWFLIGTEFNHHLGPSLKLESARGARMYASLREVSEFGVEDV